MLHTYLQRTQRLLADETQAIYSLDDLTEYVNQGREQVAAQGQCVRRLSPNSGSIMTLNVIESGSGYTNPRLAISSPDSPSGILPYPVGAQATGSAQQIGGMLSNASVTFGGSGYFEPVVTLSDPTGVGGLITATVTPLNATTYGQEVYRYSDVPMSSFPGISSILAVKSVSIQWNNWQYSLSAVGFSKYQALVRQYVSSFFAPPVWLSQYGQGDEGSIHLYPQPDQAYQMQWDCLCLPSELIDDQSPETIPKPWQTAVAYYAAHLALLGRSAEVPQLAQLAFRYFNEKDGGLFGMYMKRARAFSQVGGASSWYGRT